MCLSNSILMFSHTRSKTLLFSIKSIFPRHKKRWLCKNISVVTILLLPTLSFSQPPPLLVGKQKEVFMSLFPLIAPSDSCVTPEGIYLFRDGVCYAQIVPFPVEQHSDKLSYLKGCCQRIDSTTFKLAHKLYVTLREDSFYITNIKPDKP